MLDPCDVAPFAFDKPFPEGQKVSKSWHVYGLVLFGKGKISPSISLASHGAISTLSLSI